jgi:hypothetical protein
MSASNAPGRYQPIAIVGAACRLPDDIGDLDGLGKALEAGRDLIGEAPAERFDATRFIDTSLPRTGKSYTAAGGLLLRHRSSRYRTPSPSCWPGSCRGTRTPSIRTAGRTSTGSTPS